MEIAGKILGVLCKRHKADILHAPFSCLVAILDLEKRLFNNEEGGDALPELLLGIFDPSVLVSYLGSRMDAHALGLFAQWIRLHPLEDPISALGQSLSVVLLVL